MAACCNQNNPGSLSVPNRILREAILSSERVAALGWAEEVFYRRLMSVVDDFGRFYANPTLIRAACYPLQINKVSDSDIGKWLACAQKAALVRVYPAKDGKSYLELLDFRQQVRAKESRFPAFDPHLIRDGDADDVQLRIGCVADAHLDVSVDGVVGDRASLSSAGPTKTPTIPCPYEHIVALYREKLPSLPGIRLMDDDRKKAMRKFWSWVLTSNKSDGTRRATDADEALGWIGEYFDRASQNDFLMGRTERSGEHKNWRCDLDFLLTSRGMKQVIEKTQDAA